MFVPKVAISRNWYNKTLVHRCSRLGITVWTKGTTLSLLVIPIGSTITQTQHNNEHWLKRIQSIAIPSDNASRHLLKAVTYKYLHVIVTCGLWYKNNTGGKFSIIMSIPSDLTSERDSLFPVGHNLYISIWKHTIRWRKGRRRKVRKNPIL